MVLRFSKELLYLRYHNINNSSKCSNSILRNVTFSLCNFNITTSAAHIRSPPCLDSVVKQGPTSFNARHHTQTLLDSNYSAPHCSSSTNLSFTSDPNKTPFLSSVPSITVSYARPLQHCTSCHPLTYSPSHHHLTYSPSHHPLTCSSSLLSSPLSSGGASPLHTSTHRNLRGSNHDHNTSKIDRSLVPPLLEGDLEEKFIRGSGPGGQSVNKTSSCCYLKHIPTGLFVKCHEHRALEQNRKQAREYLRGKLDDLLNGEASVAAQRARLREAKSSKKEGKARRRQAMKDMWKESNRTEESGCAVGTEQHEEQRHVADKEKKETGNISNNTPR